MSEYGQFVWRNGEFVKNEDATVHVSAHALHYGSSVFEGIRAYATPDGPAVFRLQPHTHRLHTSCKIARMALAYNEDDINNAILETIARNGHQSCYIRPLVFRGAGRLGLEGRKSVVETIIMTMEWGCILGQRGVRKRRGCDGQFMATRCTGYRFVDGENRRAIRQQPVYQHGSARRRL